MPTRKPQGDFDVNVFINCPFDDQYNPLFLAIVFTVTVLGFRPRCSMEVNIDDRLDKIIEIICDCKYVIHDISRVEKTRIQDGTHLPRFNMPFELGIDVGLKAIGKAKNDPRLKNKRLLIMDGDPHRYQIVISDLKGRDIECHENTVPVVIAKVRHWLNEAEKRERPLPPTALVQKEYRKFRRKFRDDISFHDMSFKDYCFACAKYVDERNAIKGTSSP